MVDDIFPNSKNFYNSLAGKTILVPTNEALKEGLKDSSNEFKLFNRSLPYMTIPSMMLTNELYHNKRIIAEDGHYLRVNMYSLGEKFNSTILNLNRVMVNCGNIILNDIKCCDSIVHAVNVFLIQPRRTIWDELKHMSEYDSILRILAGTDLEAILQNPKKSLTFLAPSNRALKQLQYNMVFADRDKALDFLSAHILQGMNKYTVGEN